MGRQDDLIRPRHMLQNVTEDVAIFAWIAVAHCVGQVDRGRPGLDGGLNTAAQEILFGTGGVLGRPLHITAQIASMAHRAGDHFQDVFLAGAQNVVAVARARRQEGVDPAALGRSDRLSTALDIADPGAGQAADGAFGNDLGDAQHRLEVAVRGDGKARLDHVDLHLFEDLGQFQLLVQRHGCPW